jgi:hypothetical protein
VLVALDCASFCSPAELICLYTSKRVVERRIVTLVLGPCVDALRRLDPDGFCWTLVDLVQLSLAGDVARLLLDRSTSLNADENSGSAI